MVKRNASRKNDGGRPAENSQEPAAAPKTEGSKEGTGKAIENKNVIVDAARRKIQHAELNFPIVGIGASAGGLAAFEAFFENMPPDNESGIAFVLVQHLDPGHKSILTELVRRYTKMHVYEVEDGMNVEQNCTYIIPPNKNLVIRNGQLFLMELTAQPGLRLPIDYFFRSLAQDRGEQAICIVLSGTGTDGTLGLKAIKETGGMVMVQESESAAYDGMPRSAIATGMADYILPVNDMPAQLIAYVQNAFWKKRRPAAMTPIDVSSWIQRIEILLRAHSGHDFSDYKQTTIRRRIEKRMAVNQIEHMDQYLQFLRQNSAELGTLFRELLIGVTGFFRDPEAFEALNEKVIPLLFSDKPKANPIRVWVPGCSTGEEAYSIAILLQEHLEESGKACDIQVFATDIDHEAIEKARSGSYPISIATDVTPARLEHFFDQDDDFYSIKKSIRDMVVFADQDVIKDPPFSKIDLLSCRNLLIYWEGSLQKRVFPLFYYSIKPGGFIFLGSSETIGEYSNLFEAVDRKWRIFRRKEGKNRAALADLELPPLISTILPSQIADNQKERRTNIRDVTEKMLIHDYAPAAVLVNDHGEITYVHGHTGKYLELPVGEINTNVLRAAREGLRLELTTALRKAIAHGETVRYEGLKVKVGDVTQWINLIVRPANYPTVEPGLFLIVFEDIPQQIEMEQLAKIADENTKGDKDLRIIALEREVRSKEEYLQSTIEELETANEELKSTNEEMQSTNEELQSTNEELETSKEELQSVNEELVTVNTELQQKIDELSRLNNDMNNLMAGTGIGTVFVDLQLRIVRFTPTITRIINLIQSDIGRPLSHIASNLVNYTRLEEDTKAVLENLLPSETEVQIKNGLWFLMRILPYRTVENVIEGCVITFVDITQTKTLQESLIEEERLKAIVENVGDSIWSINSDYKLMMGNTTFFAKHRETYLREINIGDPLPPQYLSQPLQNMWKGYYKRALMGEGFKEYSTAKSAGGEMVITEYVFNPIRDTNERVTGVACFSRDVTERKHASDMFQRLTAIQHDANDAIIVHDFDGRILDWNPAATRMFGWDEEEAKAINIIEMVPEEERSTTTEYFGTLSQGKPVDVVKTRRLTKDRKIISVRSTVSVLVDDDGKPYAIMTTQQIIAPAK